MSHCIYSFILVTCFSLKKIHVTWKCSMVIWSVLRPDCSSVKRMSWTVMKDTWLIGDWGFHGGEKEDFILCIKTPCSFVECCQHFRGNSDCQLQSRCALNLKLLCYFAIIPEITLHDNPEDYSLMENNLYTFIRLCIGCRIFSFTVSVCSELLHLNSWVKEELISILETGLDHVLCDVIVHCCCTEGVL